MSFFSRGKNKLQNLYQMTDMYKYYIKSVIDNPLYQVSWKTYKMILNEYVKRVVDYMLDDNYIFKPGFGFGLFYIGKLGRKRLSNVPIDWEKTLKYGKRIYHLNEETGRYIYRYIWQPERHGFEVDNLKTYRFIPSRTNKRRLAKYIKVNKHDYMKMIRHTKYRKH